MNQYMLRIIFLSMFFFNAFPLISIGFDAPKTPSIKKIKVDGIHTDKWPKPLNQWKAVKRKDFDELINNLKKPLPEKQKAWIQEIEYSASFVNGKLTNGLFRANISNQSNKPEFLLLSPMNLSIDHLKWGDTNAVYGINSNNNVVLKNDPKKNLLTGSWNLTPTSQFNKTIFNLKLIPANITRLRITVSSDNTLSSSNGILSKKILNDDQTEWLIHLGSLSDTQISIHKKRTSNNIKSLIIADVDNSYVAKQDGFHFHSQLSLEFIGQQREHLDFEIPSDYQIDSVHWGNDHTLDWKTKHQGEVNYIRISLPEMIIGKIRPIHIKGTSTLLTEIDHSLFSFIPLNSKIKNNRIHLTIQAPLQLNKILHKGFRQTDISVLRNNNEIHHFEQNIANANLNVNISFPAFSFNSKILTLLSVSFEQTTAKSEILLAPISGTSFSTKYLLDSRWKISSIKSGNAINTFLDWSIEENNAQNQILKIDFRKPLTPDSTQSVIIEVEDISHSDKNSFHFPIVKPLSSASVEQTVSLKITSQSASILPQDSSFNKITAEAFPEYVINSSIWEDLENSDSRFQDTIYYYHADNIQTRETISTTDPLPYSKATSDITCQIDQDRIIENYTFNITSLNKTTLPILIYFNNKGPQLDWSCEGTSNIPIQAKLVDKTKLTEYNLPRDGELWIISFLSPVKGKFVLKTNRENTFSENSLKLSLASVLNSKSFTGTVTAYEQSFASYEFFTDGATEILTSDINKKIHTNTNNEKQIKKWTFQSPDNSITLKNRTLSSPGSISQFATLNLKSVIQESETNFNLHTASLVFPETMNQSDLVFSLPPKAKLVSILLNDMIIHENKTGEFSWKISEISAKPNQTIQIHYKTESSGNNIITNHKIPLPVFEGITLEQLIWNISLSDKQQIYSFSKGLFLDSSPQTLKWTERLFGPLGRSRTDRFFNPLFLNTWKHFFIQSEAHPDNKSLVEINNNPRTRVWHIRSAKGINHPDVLNFQSWNYLFISQIAWIGMGTIFILGTYIRTKEYSYRRTAGYLWYSIISAIAILSVPWIAYIAGGMLCGSILAILIPRKYLKSKEKTIPPEEIPLGSTVSYQTIPESITFLILLLIPSSISGQANTNTTSFKFPVSTNSLIHEVPEIQVLIPEIENSNSQSPLVYLKESDFDYLLSKQPTLTPDYLIKSGNYNCTIKNEQVGIVDAIYEIEVSTENKTIAIEIPLSNVSLSGKNPCQVNGINYPITLSRNNANFIITIKPSNLFNENQPESESKVNSKNSFKTITVKLSMFPLKEVLNEKSFIGMNIPMLASSTFKVTQPDNTSSQYVITDIKNNALSKLSRNNEPANIAWVNQIRIINRQEFMDSKGSQQTECSISNNVKIYPSYIKYHYDIKYSKSSSAIKSLTWSLPADMHIINIDGTNPFNHSISHTPEETLISINLNKPTQNNLHFKVECTRPYKLINNKFSLPAKLIDISTNNRLNVTTKNYVLGISSYPGTIINIPQTKELPIVQFIRSEFPQVQHTFNISSASQAIVSVKSSTDIPIILTAQPETKSVTANYEFTINPKEIILTYQAIIEIDNNSSPVFQHNITVDPRLNISSISVEEDKASRLLRWVRTENQITIFLNNKTKGTQNLTLVASIPYQAGKDFKLPDLILNNTNIINRNLTIYQNNNLQKNVRVVTDKPQSSSTNSTNNSNPLKSLLIYDSVLDSTMKLPSLHVMDSLSLPKIESFTQVDNSDEESFEVTSWIRFHSSDFPISRINFQLDQHSAMSNLVLQCSNAYLKKTVNKNNLTDIFLIPKSGTLNELILTIKYNLNSSNNLDYFLPGYHFPEYKHQIHYLNQSNNKFFHINISDATVVSSLNTSSLVKSVGAMKPDTKVLQFNKFDNIIIKKEFDSFLNNNNQVLLSDCRVWITPNQSLQGSMMLIFYSDKNEVTFSWPPNLTMSSLTVNGLQQTIPNTVSDKIQIPIAPLKTHQTILINWNSKQVSPDHLFHLQSHQFPKPLGMKIHKNLISLVPSKTTRIHPSTGIINSNRISHILSWIEELLKTYQIAFRTSKFPLENWKQFLKQVDYLTLNNSKDNNNFIFNNISYSSRKKLKSLIQQIQKLNNKIEDIKPATTNPTIKAAYIPGIEWTIELPANTVFGKHSNLESDNQIQFWCLSRNMINTLLAILFCGISLFFCKQIFRFHIGDKLENRSGYCWAIAGLLFWFCLRFSFWGLCLTIAGIYIAVLQEIKIKNSTKTEATIL